MSHFANQPQDATSVPACQAPLFRVIQAATVDFTHLPLRGQSISLTHMARLVLLNRKCHKIQLAPVAVAVVVSFSTLEAWHALNIKVTASFCSNCEQVSVDLAVSKQNSPTSFVSTQAPKDHINTGSYKT